MILTYSDRSVSDSVKLQFDCAEAPMKIATWNLERPNPSSVGKNETILAELKRVNADLVILTETNSIIDPGAEYTPLASDPLPIPGQSDYKQGENRTTVWSKYPLRRIETYDPATAVCINVQTPQGSLNVYGTVIGKLGSREQSFLPDLEKQIADWQRISQIGDICIAGDFNISFSDSYYFTKEGRKKISDCFETLQINNLTGQKAECIDHIAISDSFVKTAICTADEWNLERRKAIPRLSDHKGVWVNLNFPR